MENWKLVFVLFFQCFSISQGNHRHCLNSERTSRPGSSTEPHSALRQICSHSPSPPQHLETLTGCDSVPVVDNAAVAVESDARGTRVTYTCRSGRLIGSRVLSCNASRQWDAAPPLCTEQNNTTKSGCSNLDLLNGEITSGLKTQYSPGDKVMFQCYPSFLLEGSRTITCTQAETWVPEPPKCIKKEFTYCGVELEDWRPALEQEKLCLEEQKAELERLMSKPV